MTKLIVDIGVQGMFTRQLWDMRQKICAENLFIRVVVNGQQRQNRDVIVLLIPIGRMKLLTFVSLVER